MLRLQPPTMEAGHFHNFRCGEVYCIGPTTYHVSCALCGQSVLYQLFPQHFVLEHLSQAEECKLFNKEGKLIKYDEETDSIVKAEDDPIGNHGTDDNNPTVDLLQIAMLDIADDLSVATVEPGVFLNEEDIQSKSNWEETQTDRENKIIAVSECTEDIPSHEEAQPVLRTSKRLRPIATSSTKVIKKTPPETLYNKPSKSSIEKFIENDRISPKKQLFKESDYDQEASAYQANAEEEEAKMNEIDDEFKGNDDDEDDDNSDKESDNDQSMFFPCDQCDRCYHSRRGLQYHKRSKHNMDRTIDAKANSTVTKKRNATTKEKFKCADCDMVFRNERELRGHRWKHTGITCDICGKPFTQTGNMMRHRVRHSGIKAFKCGECDASFYTNKELNSHKICHTGRMPVICEICGRPCRDRGVLTAHMRRHTGERPAKCDVCGKSFYSFHDLNVHAVAHTSARPFVCDICGSTFQRKKALRVHKLLHSDKRKYTCKICGKAFAQSGGLNAHLRIHDAAAVRASSDVDDAVKTLVAIGESGECSIENGAVASIENAHLRTNDEQMNVAVNAQTGEVTISMTVDAIETVPWVSQ